MFCVLFLLCFQTCILFSMEKSLIESTIDYALARNEIEPPQFNSPSMIAFFTSHSLEQLCIKVKNHTDTFIDTLSNPEALESTIRKTQAIQYYCAFSRLYRNDLIIASLEQCKLTIPKEYTETEKDFKKLWYDLWQLMIPQEKTPEEALKKISNPHVIGNLLYKLMEKRERFINFFKPISTPDYFYKKLVAMETFMTNDIEQDPSKQFFQYILPTFQEKTKKFTSISDRLSTLQRNDSIFEYTGPRPLTKTEEYTSFTKINTCWNTAWTSLDPQEKRKAFEQFCLELNNYITYLEDHLTKAEEKNNSIERM